MVDEWGLIVADIEDAEIYDIEVQNACIDRFTAFEPAAGFTDMLVVGKVTITASVEFQHPDWETASYDSEDKILIPHRDVSGTREIDFETDFSMTIQCDENGVPLEIDEISFQDDYWNFVNLEYHDYK